MTHEVELKFDLAPDDVERLRASKTLAGCPAAAARYDTVYYDTSKGALHRAGYSLRVRRANGRHVQTIKRNGGGSTGLFVRQEWEREIGRIDPDRSAPMPAPLRRLLKKPGFDRLASVMRTRVRRTAWQIARGGSRIEVVLDEGKVRSGKAEAPLCELELELVEGDTRALFDLAEELGSTVPLRLGVLTKAERGRALAERRLGRPAKAEPVPLDAACSEADAFRAVVHACVRQYRLNETVLLGRRDAEAVHQARIALRRLRSAFALFRPTAHGKTEKGLRDELGWLAGELGDARDLDVLLAGLEGHDRLRDRLVAARADAYDRVETAIGSERARALMMRLLLWIETGKWCARERASDAVIALARRQLDRQWRKLLRRAGKLAGAVAEERHKLRLATKRLRYSAEFVAGLWPKPVTAARRDRFIAGLKDLQERLGELNDAYTAEAMIARLAPGLRDAVARLKRPHHEGQGVVAAEEALGRAAASAGYWL